MIDYEVRQDGSFCLILENEEFSIGDIRTQWSDGKGHYGSIDRKIDYGRNIVKFTLSSTKVWKEEISRYYERGEELDYRFSPQAMTISKQKTTIVKEYEIPLRKEDQSFQFGDGRLCYYTTRNRGGILVDTSTKRMIAAWSEKKASWVKSKDLDVSGEEKFNSMPAYRKKMAEFQGFVLEKSYI